MFQDVQRPVPGTVVDEDHLIVVYRALPDEFFEYLRDSAVRGADHGLFVEQRDNDAELQNSPLTGEVNRLPPYFNFIAMIPSDH